ncbi:hypothetical protein GCM10022204_07640 [Microlunatus aurantiacus]|uniref:DUF4192 domain-containing protein n=1 Tax=Microlunatus aurantiacus TaxID=446786 RepID=A0ABP7CSV6_9ACTN
MTRRAPAPAPTPRPTVLRVREPGDILGIVPYLLGFHPVESLVVAFVRDRRIAVTARIDLAAVADIEGLLDQLEQVGSRVGSRSLVMIGYSADDSVRGVMRDLADQVPWDLLDVLAVSGGRWWSVCCEEGRCAEGCCTPEGRPYDVGAHPLAAQAVLAGISATATREEIAALTAPPPASERDRLGRATSEVAARVAGSGGRRRRQLMKRLVESSLHTGTTDEVQAIELAVLAQDVAVRDVAWALMTRPRADEHLQLWRRVVAVAVPPYEAAPLGLLAIAGWLSGNGALLNCCIDRLEEVDPDYSLLWLCRDISEQAIPPRQFDAIAAELRSQVH